MKSQTRVLCKLATILAAAVWLSGCGGDTKKDAPAKPTGGTQAKPDKHEEAGHKEGEHKEAGHHEAEHKEAVHKEAGHEKAHGHGSEADLNASVEKLANYADAMHEIEEHREEIEHLIDAGKLADVHPPAQHISLIAKRLPELAQKSDVPKEHWKDINTQSRDLANLFDEIDEAADAGKKPESEAVFAKMVRLIDSLKTHAEHKERKEKK